MANGGPQREVALIAAACALVQCSAQYVEDSDEKKYWAAIEAEGNKPDAQADRACLADQAQTVVSYAAGSFWESTQHLFAYEAMDALKDGASRNQIGTRTLGDCRC